jgi:hypothetical protein
MRRPKAHVRKETTLMPKPTDKREQAVCKAAREIFSLELAMEHGDSERRVKMHELRKALEPAYDLGREAEMS